MSKPNSKKPTQSPLPKEELLELRRTTPCRHFAIGDCPRGDSCHFLHEKPRVVTHNRTSHQQNASVQPAPKTVAEIMKQIVSMKTCGIISRQILNQYQQIETLLFLVQMKKKLQGILESSNLTKSEVISCLQEFLKFSRISAMITENIKMIKQDDTTEEDIQSILDGFIEAICLPSEVEGLIQRPSDELQNSTKSSPSFASAVRTDTIDFASRNQEDQEGDPSPDFLKHLSTICNLSGHGDFEDMCRDNSSARENGLQLPFKVKHFLQLKGLAEARKVADTTREQIRLEGIQREQMSSAKAELLRQCMTTSGSILNISYHLLSNVSEFSIFVDGLSPDEHQVLLTVFGSFMAYISQTYESQEKKGVSTEFTADFLTVTFKSFSQSRKVDPNSTLFKEDFFRIAQTDQFEELIQILHKETSSLIERKNRDGRTVRSPIFIYEMSKYIMKDICKIFLDQVPDAHRDEFYVNLVKHILPFAFLISLSPQNSNMLCGRWNPGYVKDGKLCDEYAFKQMEEHTKAKKSILYWLLSYVNQKKVKRTKRGAEFQPCDDFSKLSGEFRQKKSEDPSDDTTVFNQELLFKALDSILVDSFLKSSDFDIKLKHINPTNLGTLFKVEDDSVSISDSFPPILLMAIYYAFGCDESDPKTRRLSDLKAIFIVSPKFILTIVEACQNFDQHNSGTSVKTLLKLLHIQGNTALENAVMSFMTLLSKNTTDDLLQRAYDVMSLGTNLEGILGNRSYFLSLIDALLVVLLMDNFKRVKLFDILNAVYEGKHHSGMKIPYPRLNGICESSDHEGKDVAMIQRMRELLGKGITSDENELSNLKRVVSSISEILCKKLQAENSFHEIFKRFLPFLLNKLSLIGLLKNVPGFQIVSSESSSFSVEMLVERIQTQFDSELSNFMLQQNEAIQRDLKKRISQINETPSLAERIKSLRFTKHISAIINLLTNLFSSIRLSHTITYDAMIENFPNTKDVANPEKIVKIVAKHVMAVINVRKPRRPDIVKRIQTLEMDEKDLSEEQKTKLVLSETDQQALHAYNRSLKTFKTIEHLVRTAISAIYRVELPKNEVSKQRKVKTIKLQELKNVLQSSTDLYDIFNKCLPYWKSELVRTTILSILDHAYRAGDQHVMDLYKQIQLFDVQFEVNEISHLQGMFSSIKDGLCPTTSSVDTKSDSEQFFFHEIMESFTSEFWTDDVQIEESQIVKKTGTIIRASGGGPAPAPKPFDPVVLAELLSSDNKSDAITYMQECVLNQDASDILAYLVDDEDSNCADALEALGQFFKLN